METLFCVLWNTKMLRRSSYPRAQRSYTNPDLTDVRWNLAIYHHLSNITQCRTAAASLGAVINYFTVQPLACIYYISVCATFNDGKRIHNNFEMI